MSECSHVVAGEVTQDAMHPIPTLRMRGRIGDERRIVDRLVDAIEKLQKGVWVQYRTLPNWRLREAPNSPW